MMWLMMKEEVQWMKLVIEDGWIFLFCIDGVEN